ncbi:heat shock factor binding protein 1-domain-containing protein [Haematococcus lacustris]
MDSQKGVSAAVSDTELTTLVQGLLSQMRQRFDKMSDNIIRKVDDMGVSIDELEKSIGELLEQGQPQSK